MERHNTPLIISAGTTSSWKIAYLDEVLNEMGVKAEIIPVKTSSGVSDQPTNEDQVVQGSINRAENALKQESDCDFAIGIEVGYQKNQGKYQMFCYATAVNNNGHKVTEYSSKLLLPKYFQKLLNNGDYLGEFVEAYENYKDLPEFLYLARVIRYRKPFITEAIRNTLLVFLNKDEY